MKKTNRVAVTAIFIAMYFVLSALLKIPVGGHITLDMGYIALTVAAVYLGAVPAMLVGGIGVFLESAVMSQRGVSPGWILMNLIVGFFCGWVLHKAIDGEKKKFWISACTVIPLSMLAGVTVKTLIDCAIYDLPLAAKIPTGLIALAADSAVMLAIGIPLSLAMKNRIKL